MVAKKCRTASAGLMQEYGMRLEKTRKPLPAVARLQAGRGFRAGLQANSQTPGSPPPCVGCDVAAAGSLALAQRLRCDFAVLVCCAVP